MNPIPLAPLQLLFRAVPRWARQFVLLFIMALVAFLPWAVVHAIGMPGVLFADGSRLATSLAAVVRFVTLVVLSGMVAARLAEGRIRVSIEDLVGCGFRVLGSVLALGILPGLVLVLLAFVSGRQVATPTLLMTAGIALYLLLMPIYARVALAGPALVLEQLSAKAGVERAIALSSGSRVRLSVAIVGCQVADWILQNLAGRAGLPTLGIVLLLLVATALSASLLAVVLAEAYQDRRGEQPAEVAEVFA
jgi:hypothetical protein